jgi:anti-sigma regulatory factor (Ser/Thr protein kinase)
MTEPTCTTTDKPRPVAAGVAVSYLQLVALPSAAFWARRYAETVLRAWRLQQEGIETAQLLVSELVTNSVKFTGSPSARVSYAELADVKSISLILRHNAGQLIIEVCDPDPTPPVLTETDPDAESGRGLMLVRALSKEWNYYLPPSGGKTVLGLNQ